MAQGLRGLIKGVAGRVPLAATCLDHVLFHAARVRARSDGRPPNLLSLLRQNGYAVIENYLSSDECSRCIEDFERLLRAHPEHTRRHSDVRIFGVEELCSHARPFALDALLATIADQYVGRVTVNAFTMANRVDTFAGSKGSGEGWHKDSSFRQFKAILYLNEVSEENGPFQLLRDSHKLTGYLRDIRTAALKFRHLRVDDTQVAALLRRRPDRLVTFTGGPGTLILVDTAAVHRGCPPRSGVRYSLTNYYVEPHQITDEFMSAYGPVRPDKVRSRAVSSPRSARPWAS